MNGMKIKKEKKVCKGPKLLLIDFYLRVVSDDETLCGSFSFLRLELPFAQGVLCTSLVELGA